MGPLTFHSSHSYPPQWWVQLSCTTHQTFAQEGKDVEDAKEPESLTKQPFKHTRFLKMGIYKPQNSLATAAEFASASKARGKERIPDIVITVSLMCQSQKQLGVGEINEYPSVETKHKSTSVSYSVLVWFFMEILFRMREDLPQGLSGSFHAWPGGKHRRMWDWRWEERLAVIISVGCFDASLTDKWTFL